MSIPHPSSPSTVLRYVYTEKTCGSKLDSVVYHGAIRWLTNARTQVENSTRMERRAQLTTPSFLPRLAQAYNAFARTKMRQLNITIVDQFWQSTARPKGLPGDEKSTDAVHHSLATVRGYSPYVYHRVCEALRDKFPGDNKEAQPKASEAHIDDDVDIEPEMESLDTLTAELES